MICKDVFNNIVSLKDCIKPAQFDALTDFYDMMYDASITFKASSNMIRLNIGNLLNFKHIKMESFVKDLSTFNIVESIQEVINI